MNEHQLVVYGTEESPNYGTRFRENVVRFDGGTAIYQRNEQLGVRFDNADSTPISAIDWGHARNQELKNLMLKLIAFRLIEDASPEILPALLDELRAAIEYEQKILEEQAKRVRYITSETRMLPVLG